MTETIRPLSPLIIRVCLLTLIAGIWGAHALPITFEENRGQAPPPVAFVSRTSNYHIFLTNDEAVIAPLGGPPVRMRLAKARPAIPVGTHALIAKSNYLAGPDPSHWRTGISNYAGVTYVQPYPGIDLVWHARGDQIEHDFLLAANADSRRIELVFSGATLRLTSDGDLMAGALRFQKPRAYQGSREVECRYELHGRRVHFALGRYDRSQPLTIDPVLSFSTYFGGTLSSAGQPGSAPATTALDSAGNLYVAGTTDELDFPLTANAPQRTATGGACKMYTFFMGGPVQIPCTDIFVSKFSGDGQTLLYSTYLDGPNAATAIAVGPAGSVYLIGTGGFKTPTLAPLAGQASATTQSFLIQLSADGSAVRYATALPVLASALAVDAAGAVYLTGTTTGSLPTVNPFQPALGDVGNLLKTTDGGSHWQPFRNGLPPGQLVAVDPTNSQVLYVGSPPNGLHKSSDGGASWSSIGNGLGAGFLAKALVIDPRSPQTLYLGGNDQLSANCPCLYKSTDGGATWTSSANGIPSASQPPTALALDPSTPSTLYAGTATGVYKSTDGAANWTPTGLSFVPSQQTSVGRIIVDPTNGSAVYAAMGSTAVMKSVDGGSSWTKQDLCCIQSSTLTMDPNNPQTLYIVSNGVSKTTDGGAHWTGLGTWLSQAGALQSLLVDPKLSSRIWVGTTKGVFVSVNSGATWTLTALPNVSIVGLAADAGGAIYAVRGYDLLSSNGTLGDAFVMKIDATGSNITYSTYVGGVGRDFPHGIAVDAAGRAYIAGETDSPDFPLASPLQAQYGGTSDVFVAVLDPGGAHVVWSTYLGGGGAEGATSIALDAAGNVHLGAVRSLINPFPGGGNPLNVFPVGPYMLSEGAFVTKIRGDGSAVIFSAQLPGSAFDVNPAVAADGAGNTYIAASTTSPDLTAVNAVQPTIGGNADAFVAEFDGVTGALHYATYLGGRQDDHASALAVDAAGNTFVVGTTSSADFPLKAPLQGAIGTTSQAFVAKLATQGPGPGINGLANAASYTTTVAPGELVSLFGTGLAATTAPATQLPLPVQLSDAHVTINGIPAPLVYVSPQQVNLQIPFETQPGTMQAQISSSAGSSTVSVHVAAAAPALFTLNQQGTGPGAILHGTSYQVVTDSNPAAAGETISIYCTGLGAVNPAAQTGAAPPDPPSQTVLPVQVSIGTYGAQVLYAGVAPGFAGLYQINVQIPANVKSGAQPLLISQNGLLSNTVTIAIQ